MTHSLRAPLALALVGLAALGARADLKVVSKSVFENRPNVPGAPAPAKTAKAGEPDAVQSTMYYKGTFSRSEDGTDTVTITDTAKNTITTLNVKKKTYSVQKLDELAKMASPFAEFMDVKIEGGVKPGTMPKKVAGRDTGHFVTNLSIAMSVKEGSPLPLPAGDGPLMSIAIRTESWTVEGLSLDAKAIQQQNLGMMRMFTRMLPGAAALQDKMAGVKGYPLASNTRITFTSALPLPGLPDKPMTIKNEVISLSEDPLPDTLFQVPADFKEVPPETPGIPGFGGGN